MKTPEEIKKGLECCMVEECFGERENCPYTADPALCVGVMCGDALALIQQLEKDKNDLLEERELNDFLRDRVKQLEAKYKPRWIPVEERLPDEGKNVLIFVKCMNNWWHIEVDWRIGGCWFNNAETDWNKITHWMEMPEPPEEGEE